MLDLKNIIIMGNTLSKTTDNVKPDVVIPNIGSISKIDTVNNKPKSKNINIPVKKILVKIDRETALNELIASINEKDEDDGGLLLTHKEGSKLIIKFVRDNYIGERKELLI